MGLFSGLEKFGFSEDDIDQIKKETKKTNKKANGTAKKEIVELEEKDYLLDKTMKCPICDKDFTTKLVKTGRAKRIEPDFDLRPRYDGIDTLKYDVILCPNCGYAAMQKNFSQIPTAQAKLVRNAVASKFKPMNLPPMETYSYEVALDRYKLSLVSTIAKRGKESEKMYTCLKMAWMLRDVIADMPADTEEEKALVAERQQEYEAMYKQAYEGLQGVLSTEMPPYCGMDSATLEFMLANMAIKFKQYDVASKLVATLLTSNGVNARIKDKCYDLKEQIIQEVKAQK